jgi:hypothetical protein
MRNVVKKSVLIASCLSAVLGCSDKNKKAASADGDQVTYNLPLVVKASAPAEIREFAGKITNQKPVSFRAITAMLIKKHAKSVSAERLTEMIKEVIPADESLNARKMKIAYEKAIESKLGRPLVYNKEKVNLADVLGEGKLQCYSGTYLFELIRRQRGAQKFRAGQEVVIFTKGHIKAGYIERSANKTVVFGIETTESGGGGHVVEVFTQNSKKAHSRIIDAEIFALVEVVQEHLVNGADVLREAEKQTAAKYGFEPMDVLEAAGSGGSAEAMLNASIFGFGEVQVAEGDQARTLSMDADGAKDISRSGAAAMEIPVQTISSADQRNVFVALGMRQHFLMQVYEVPFGTAQLLLSCSSEECFQKKLDGIQRSVCMAQWRYRGEEFQMSCQKGQYYVRKDEKFQEPKDLTSSLFRGKFLVMNETPGPREVYIYRLPPSTDLPGQK